MNSNYHYYKNLYNSVGDGDELLEVQKDIEEKVNFSNLEDVKKVTPEAVKEAASNLKTQKVIQYLILIVIV